MPWVANSSEYNADRRPLIDDYRQWTFEVNGRPIVARGANWVPRDQMCGRAVREEALKEVSVKEELSKPLL